MLILKAKEGVDVAYPLLHLWVDRATGNAKLANFKALFGNTK